MCNLNERSRKKDPYKQGHHPYKRSITHEPKICDENMDSYGVGLYEKKRSLVNVSQIQLRVLLSEIKSLTLTRFVPFDQDYTFVRVDYVCENTN